MDRQFGFRKTRFLCLHGFRSSGKILQTELKQWPDFVLGKMDLVFVDAPFPAEGKSGHEGKFDPPYYEWFQSNEGALLSAVLPGMQAQGVALTRVLKINFVIVISGGKFGGSKFSSPKLAENAFSSPIECPSLHIYGEDDFAKPNAIELLDSFVIHHHEDEKDLEVMLSFIEKIQGGWEGT